MRTNVSLRLAIAASLAVLSVGCGKANGNTPQLDAGATDGSTTDGSTTDGSTTDGSTTDAGMVELSAPLATTPTVGTVSQGQVDGLGLGYYIATSGIFPSTSGGVNTSGTPFLGQILLFAGNFAPSGYHACDGSLLDIGANSALFTLLGTTYGGDGVTTFALPDLRNRVPMGVGTIAGATSPPMGTGTIVVPQVTGVTLGQVVRGRVEGLGLTVVIATNGIFPSPGGSGTSAGWIGAIMLFAGNFAPGGYVPCDGSLLDIGTNTAFFSVIGTTYGGDGSTTFAVPDLRARTPMGIGPSSGTSVTPPAPGAPQVPLVDTLALGSTAVGQVGVLGIGVYVQTLGVFPSSSGGGGSDAYIASLLFSAAGFAPGSSAPCDGSLLTIASNTALFSLLGTNYGGNGTTNFALPDLRSRVLVGAN